MTNPKDATPFSRDILPIPDRPHVGVTTYDAKDPATKFAPIEPLRPPKGAPNILIVLIDDAGFGASSAFGGPCRTPTAERLASRGLKYNRFHTTALCSPTRQALLTGRNHHSVNMGGITEIATSAPGYNSIRPKDKAPIAEVLKLNGYSTAQFGKCHEVPVWETSPMGPFHQWPTGSGFEHFFGFVGGETNQYYPGLFEGTTPVEPDRSPEEGYHFMEDMTSRAIKWVKQQKALMPDKPFFMYFAPGATHAPHHAPKEWIEKYKGQFDDGWDKLRERTFARQKELGVIPRDAELSARPDEIPAWDDMPDELKPILRREMEVYAGFMEYTDHHVGRLFDTLGELRVLDDTIVYYVIGDNGASGEGTLNGCFNELAVLNGMAGIETPEFLMSKLEDFGGPKAYNHYAVGWAHALDTPYQWTKQFASHWGGTRNGTIVSWPNGIRARGEIRSQFCHVIDVAPTLLEVAGLPAPTFVNGIQQAPHEGFSMAYSFDDARAPERHTTQYFELAGNRGIYHAGWSAMTKHANIPWAAVQTPPLDEDVWELYAPEDWTQARDLAAQDPKKLQYLQRLFLIEAARHNVLPIDDRKFERFNADLAGRPQLIEGSRQILYGGMDRLTEGSIVSTKNKSHTVTAEVDVPESGAEGVIIAQGGSVGGWSLYAKDGKPTYCYNFFGIEPFIVDSTAAIPPGTHQVRMEFKYEGGGLAKGGDVSLFIDDRRVGEGHVGRTEPMAFSCDETCDVGLELGSPVSPEYGTHNNKFSGEVHWVRIDLGSDSHDHLISPEQRMQVAASRQ